jgi:hypothetical protein
MLVKYDVFMALIVSIDVPRKTSVPLQHIGMSLLKKVTEFVWGQAKLILLMSLNNI